MPNVKIYVDETVFPSLKPEIGKLLPALRSVLCDDLAVDISACQLAVMPVLGLSDQPLINAELAILPRPERTQSVVRSVAERVRKMLEEISGQRVAVRVSALDPVTYFALK